MEKKECAGGVVINESNEIIVVSNRGVSWSLPKGKIMDGEDVLVAAEREIFEETGLEDLEFVKELGVYGRYRNGPNGTEDKNKYKTIHVFLFKSSKKKLQPVDPHNPEARWVTRQVAVEMLTHQKDKEFLQSVMDLF